MDRILLNGVSRADRHAAIALATEAIGQAGGWVDDVLFFSNIAVTILCSAGAGSGAALKERLAALPVRFGPQDLADLESSASRLPSGEELRFSIQITFMHDEPDLRRHIPSVPG